MQILLISVVLSCHPVFAQQLNQYPTLSVSPSNVVMYTPVTTINIAINPVTGLNMLHLIFSFNSQAPFLSVSTGDVALGNLFAGQGATLYTNIYSLNSTGLSYVNALISMPTSTSGVSSTTTENVLAITLHLLPNSAEGLQSGLNFQEADALFTDGQYIDSTSGLTLQGGLLTVGYLTTVLTATSVTTTAGSSVTLTSALQDSEGNPLLGMSVNYYIGSQSVGTGITDASGLSSVIYTPSSAGTYTINAMFVGNQTGGTFASSSATATLTVNPQNTQPTTKATTLSLSLPQTVTAQTVTTIQATLTQGTNPLSSENIIFSAVLSGGSMSSIGSNVTNSNGVATISFTFSTAGSYSVEAQFLGDTNNQPSNNTVSVTVSPKPLISTILTLSTPGGTTVNKEVLLSSTLVDSSQQPIAGATVVYSAIAPNGVQQAIGSAETGSSGSSSIPFTPTQAQIYQIDANYAGSSVYSPSNASQYLTVNVLTSNQTATSIALTLSTNETNMQTFITITATLQDQSGNPLAQENIVYQYSTDGSTWNNITTQTTASDGVAQASYKPDQTGALLVRGVFNGDANYYASSSNEEQLSVNNGTTTATPTPTVTSTSTATSSPTVTPTPKVTNPSNGIPWTLIIVVIAVAVVVIVVAAFAVTKLRKNEEPVPPLSRTTRKKS
jgi:hypothetical protein